MPELILSWIFINRAAYQYPQNTWNWKSSEKWPFLVWFPSEPNLYMQLLEWSDLVGSRSEYWIRNVNSLPPHTRDILRSVAFQKPWHYFIFLFYKMFSSIDLASERFLKILVLILCACECKLFFLLNLKSYSLKWKAAIKLWFCLPRSLPCFKIFIMEEFWCNALLLFS